MEKKDIPFLTATELSGLIQSGQVSPVEAAEAYFDRIAEVDGKLNSYITVTREHALEQARDSGDGDRPGRPPRSPPRRTGGGQRPVQHRRYSDHRRVQRIVRLRAR